jgi:hypothetical protein
LSEKTWTRRRSAWRDDAEFVELAKKEWPVELMWAGRKYDKGATQRLKLRWEGWRVGRREG